MNHSAKLQSKISLTIPILSLDRKQINEALVQKFGQRYTIAGKVFLDNQTQKYCLIEILENSDHFINYCQSLESDIPIEDFQDCVAIVVLTSYKLGYVSCCQLAQYAEIFLNLGGVMVIADTTAKVIDKAEWLTKCNSEDVFDIYLLYVILVEEESYYYSCGMNNFGKPDVSLDLSEDIGLANYVINVFNYYRLTESVIIQENQTFQPDLECPKYQIIWREEQQKVLSGIWHLARIDKDQILDISYEIN